MAKTTKKATSKRQRTLKDLSAKVKDVNREDAKQVKGGKAPRKTY